MIKPELFYLERLEDESGISGTGIVAVGVKLPSGKVVIEWTTFTSSIGIYNNIEQCEELHGHGGKTRIVMGLPPEKEEPKKKRTRKKKAT